MNLIELQPFLKYIFISLGVLLLIFFIVTLLLVLRLRKEREEFERATAEAIRKFEEGFKTSTAVEFVSNAEHKHYEVPFASWEMGE
jgi:uncharacterized protein YpmS